MHCTAALLSISSIIVHILLLLHLLPGFIHHLYANQKNASVKGNMSAPDVTVHINIKSVRDSRKQEGKGK